MGLPLVLAEPRFRGRSQAGLSPWRWRPSSRSGKLPLMPTEQLRVGIVIGLAVMGGLSQLACVRLDKCGAPPPTPNGRKAQLLFVPEGGHDLGEALFQDVALPARVDAAEVDFWSILNPGETTREACADPYVVDFSGTTLEAEGNSFLEVLESQRSGENYIVRVRCRPGPYPVEERLGVSHIFRDTQRAGVVQVRILAGTRVRYEDSFGLACWQASEFSLASDSNLHRIGDSFSVRYTLLSKWELEDVATGQVRPFTQKLFGRGFEVRGSQPPVEIYRTSAFDLGFQAIRPGRDPTIAAGHLETVLSLTVTD
jgi:hypothetical protein